MKSLKIYDYTADFAENKDVAQELRKTKIEPSIEKTGSITLDFNGVTSATQSFIHALISQVIRQHGADVLDKIIFKNCNKKIRTIIQIVVDYVQDGLYSPDHDEEELN
ncbi:MAG TPA: STAS-like domain-containing protein [Flavitalea sp.]|nr:STAS-like domain-containing protein [Flavitalea sp.]